MPISELAPLPVELQEWQEKIEKLAAGHGLDFFPTIFEMVPADRLNEIAAKGGFPVRYPHWRFGMEYEKLGKGYHYGLQKIYELVINNDPCYAYLMASNEMVDQKLVMAHVYGHCDFFKCNAWFGHTNRKMMDQMANHGARIRRYMDEVGVEPVEEFIDACLSIEDLIDIHSPFIKRRADKHDNGENKHSPPKPARFDSKEYLDPFVNPKAEYKRNNAEDNPQPQRLPERPERDVMLFLLEQAPLNAWQADVLSIIRDEAYYFAPQGQTKIMNEGWASYWHSKMMTTQIASAAEIVQFADHHSGTVASSGGSLNPYKLGIELFRDIEDRWNRGAYGKEYEDCDDYAERQDWDRELGEGRDKIFEVRRVHNDLTFIDSFLTLDFVRQHKLFKFGYNPGTEYYEIETRAFPQVKQQLLANLTNLGRPQIAVVDGNYKNRGELYLEHEYTGVELQTNYAQDTLRNLHRLWTRPVHIATILDETQTVISFDGGEVSVDQGDDVDPDDDD
ncbi:SpoVR family protein [Posidoniimonas corsicana]|uniref:SpoVR family protein n=1 Tax=Posidoniimonas corsicana TaxID=1938618 RepID=A0A5C5VEC8_9BACT|nr:SpoVR family protein [Posidoniimonas corsicana]TWT36501.1 SpoVR family protein [Posidoniimonas corsicana]